MKGCVCMAACVCVVMKRCPYRKTSKLNAIVLTSMDTSKRSGITQSSPLKIPYKSLTERRISSVFTWELTEITRLEELVSNRNFLWQILCNCVFLYAISAFCSFLQAEVRVKSSLGKIKDTQRRSKHHGATEHQGVCSLAHIDHMNVKVVVVGGPQRPTDPGWVPPPALSSCSGGRIKRVSLTGLTSSHPFHQSEGSKVRSIGSPWPTVCNRA